MISVIFLILIAILAVFFVMKSYQKAVSLQFNTVAASDQRMAAKPVYHASFSAVCVLFGAMVSVLIVLLINHFLLLEIAMPITILASLVGASIGGSYAGSRVQQTFNARVVVERCLRGVLFCCAAVAVLTTLAIVLSVLFESLLFFKKVSLTDFLFGTQWSPQIAMRADQAGATGLFGILPLLAGTLLITAIAMSIAAPIGLMSAIYLSEYASEKARAFFKPVLELLAGIPTVVYGFFAALAVAPWVRRFGESMGWSVSSESALAAGLVMGVMIIPFVSSLSDDVIRAVPQTLRDGALGLGSTRGEMIRQVVLPAALPGIVSGMLLAVSRAIGETMIVVMAAGMAANLTANPLESVTTVTVQIVTLLTGDQEFDSAKTLAAFALGLVLFVITLMLNVIALQVVNKYREQYD
ncbi:phosphate ABC transporter membrane protein 1 (PhoT family) [Sinobacterium caligoides]|uniref:Phosphate transport system permease protein n=1 Tax=Sinobacterium caligoides TaxID=933926 RepID=A0A3N2DZR7_9GAMM|nr:phosphate ABC transporter permease subunit PstC [Sinobacterium caligoides]ROS05340.1 phosphate ABC transporter membrane protein 1 (PhoT family) [Sinobacterium caligoides]